MHTNTETDDTCSAMRSALAEVGAYFGLDQLLPDASPDRLRAYAEQVQAEASKSATSVDRVRRSALYVDRIHTEWLDARSDERKAKADFLSALLHASEPAIPALCAPLVTQVSRRPGQDEERVTDDRRGFSLYTTGLTPVASDASGSDDDVRITATERGVYVDECGQLLIGHHQLGESPSGVVTIRSEYSETSIEEILGEFSRPVFMALVDTLVSTIWKLARNTKRKEQIRESHALADRLHAVRMLLEDKS
jgi:hypothetical protein